jgi:hypothetical protein
MALKKKPKTFGSGAGYIHPDETPEKTYPAPLKPVLVILTVLFGLRGLTLLLGGDWLFSSVVGLGETLPEGTLHARVAGCLYLLWSYLTFQAFKDPVKNLAIIQGTYYALVLLIALGVVAAASGTLPHPLLWLRPIVLTVLAMLIFLYKPVAL